MIKALVLTTLVAAALVAGETDREPRSKLMHLDNDDGTVPILNPAVYLNNTALLEEDAQKAASGPQPFRFGYVYVL